MKFTSLLSFLLVLVASAAVGRAQFFFKNAGGTPVAVGLKAGSVPYEFFAATEPFECDGTASCVRKLACVYQSRLDVQFFAVCNLSSPSAERLPIRITYEPTEVTRTALLQANSTCPASTRFPFLPQAMVLALTRVSNTTDRWFQIEAPFRQTTCSHPEECVVALKWVAQTTGCGALIPPCAQLEGDYCG